MRSSKYVVQPAYGTSCPRCHSRPRLLVRQDGLIVRHAAFYLCRCGFVGQVGVGPVEEVSEEEHRDDRGPV